MHLAGVTKNPDDVWVTQQARNACSELVGEGIAPQFLIRVRDAKFTRSFDTVFEADGVRIITTPTQAPDANAYTERWGGYGALECLDWTQVLGEYVEHYDAH